MFELTHSMFLLHGQRSLVIAAKPVKRPILVFYVASASAPGPVSQCISPDYRAKPGAEDEVASFASEHFKLKKTANVRENSGGISPQMPRPEIVS
jgi:hypothetical protein